MIYSFLILSLFAHEDLASTSCQSGKQKILVTHLAKDKYELKLPGQKKMMPYSKPKVQDEYDATQKQLFDTYHFQINDKKLVFKRPETKGPIKKTRAFFENKVFDCQKI